MKIDNQILKRYLNGFESEGDNEIIYRWFSNEFIHVGSDLRKHEQLFWDELSNEQDIEGYDGSIILDRIYHTIKLQESNSIRAKNIRTRFINVFSKVAAVLFIPLLVSFLFFGDGFRSGNWESAYSEIYSPLGARTQFNLPDGSTGWLNGGSSIKFPARFNGKSRDIILKGEAYFDVKSNPKKPFIVKGENIEVVARGTSFNVMAYPADPLRKVTLISGKINVTGTINGRAHEFGLIDPGHMCVLDLINTSCKEAIVDVDIITSWKEGRLVFRNEPFSEVVRKINRWYNVNMVIKDKVVESYTYMATFEDENLDEVLKLLTLSAPIDFRDIGRDRKKNGVYGKRKIEIYYNPK